jgi:hypothetical protein
VRGSPQSEENSDVRSVVVLIGAKFPTTVFLSAFCDWRLLWRKHGCTVRVSLRQGTCAEQSKTASVRKDLHGVNQTKSLSRHG